MSQGLIIAFLGTFSSFVLIQNLSFSTISTVFNGKVIIFVLVINSIVAIGSYLLYKSLEMEDPVQSMLFYTAIMDIVIVLYLIVQNWEEISQSMSEAKKWSNKMARVVLGFSLMIYFSNSFIINEQKVLCYLLMGMLIHALYDIQKSTKVCILLFQMF